MSLINRNMRCIEMVLSVVYRIRRRQINRNMRCIEICAYKRDSAGDNMINRNMRCIEICFRFHGYSAPLRLIET